MQKTMQNYTNTFLHNKTHAHFLQDYVKKTSSLLFITSEFDTVIPTLDAQMLYIFINIWKIHDFFQFSKIS